ncbi:MAG: DsbA family protein [Ilumatobacteraceae bacterium]
MNTFETPSSLEFFFDPGCPWTWATSRWLVDAAAVRDIDVVWRNLSLGVLNEGRELSEHLRLTLPAGKVAHRLIAALVAAGRNDLIGAFYTQYGRRVHHDQVAPSPDLVRDVALATSCDEWVGALDDDAWDAPVAESTRLAMSLAGPDVGSPIIAFGTPRVGIFGPIVSPPPTGEQAQRLLDVVLLVAQCSGFFEIKRGRSGPVQLGPRP